MTDRRVLLGEPLWCPVTLALMSDAEKPRRSQVEPGSPGIERRILFLVERRHLATSVK